MRAHWQLGPQRLSVYSNLGTEDLALVGDPPPAVNWLHGDPAAITAFIHGRLPAATTLVFLEPAT